MKKSGPELVNRLQLIQSALLICMILSVWAFSSQTAFGSQTLIPAGAVWKYIDDGTNQGTIWKEREFYDAHWPSGLAQLGFGDGDEQTMLRIAPDFSQRAITFYFRHAFVVTQPGTISNLVVRLLRDDGGVVYLNGVEVFRSNMPNTPIDYTTLASSNVGPPDETTQFYSNAVNPNLLFEGFNVLAVEIHQVGLTSGDISFDLGLEADGVVTNVLPVINVVATDDSAAEDNPNSEQPTNPGRFTFVRSGPTNDALQISYALSGTASNGVDYATLPGVVEMAAGVQGVTIQVDILDDSEIEGTEVIVLSLTRPPCLNTSPIEPSCYHIGRDSRAVISVIDQDQPPNRPPTVSLVAPANGAEFFGPTNITLVANANDPDGYPSLKTVEFFEGTNSLGIRTNYPVLAPAGPFVLQWQNVLPGEYTLTAVATDHQSATGTSTPVHIVVRSQPPPMPATTFIPARGLWKYLDNGTDQGTGWRELDFNDEQWSSGLAQLGYGDGDEQTVIGYGPDTQNKYITTYFRRGFEASSNDAVTNLALRVLRDDGIVVYLNGTEVYRNNMPVGPVGFQTTALSAVEDNNSYIATSIPFNALVAGHNVIAAEVHQINGMSSDLGFDLELIANTGGPPPPMPVVNVVATSPNAAEGGLNSEGFSGAFTFYRNGDLAPELTAYFAVSGSAVNGVDYARVTNRITFAQGSSETRLVITPLFDNLAEPTETVVVTLESPACAAMVPPPPGCYSVGQQNQAIVFIADAPQSTNRPPNVNIVTPHEGDTFPAGSNIQLGANAPDDGQVVGLEFFANGSKIGDAEGPLTTPMGAWLLTWSNVVAGDYALTARATDDTGLTRTAGPIPIHVLSGGESNLTFIAQGSVWKYSDQGLDLGSTWRGIDYDDDDWASGPAQLGYGDGDEQTIVSYGPNPSGKYITTYFRKHFVVSNPTNFAALHGLLVVDDGAAVYLNGTEVFRHNLPPGALYNTFASSVVEDQTVTFSVSPNLLVNGENLVAVEVHQVSPGSTDVSFDFRLLGEFGSPPDPGPTNHAPLVQLNAPRNSDVFVSPTNIELVAYAEDAEDGYELTVEFFAGNFSLGFGTFNPTRCATPYCPNFTLTWSNIPPGNYRLTARATDKSGASGVSAPVNIAVQGERVGDPELHVVGIYTGTATNGGVSHNNERGDASVLVNRPGKRVTLYLSAYEPVLWHISEGDATVVERVFVSGYYHQEVAGGGPGMEVISTSFEDGTGYLLTGYTLEAGRFYQALPKICALTGMEISSFQGSYQAPHPDPFLVDSVQEDERLRCNYPVPTPASELPSLNFRLAFYEGGIPGNGQVFFQNYTLQGAANTGRLLPAWRVVGDGGGRFYYGAERQDVFKTDSETGAAELMEFGPDLPEVSWPMGVAFDSQQQRVLLATLGGEGYLYGYAPSSSQWSLVSSMHSIDVDCLEYHAPSNTFFAVKVNHSDYGAAAIYELSADGDLLREIALPVFPFNIGPIGYRSELASVGEYLVLLVEPDAHFSWSEEPNESRMYLIDPRTEQIWLTYRRTGPYGNTAQDSDGDGVADINDSCLGTTAGAAVNSQGCSIAQLCLCDTLSRTNADYVRCVIDQSWRFYRDGLITEADRRAIIGEAAQSDCGLASAETSCLNVQPQLTAEVRQNGICFVVSGPTSGTCVLECSTNLVDWIPIQTVTMPSPSMEVADTTAGDAPARFYRLRCEP